MASSPRIWNTLADTRTLTILTHEAWPSLRGHLAPLARDRLERPMDVDPQGYVVVPRETLHRLLIEEIARIEDRWKLV